MKAPGFRSALLAVLLACSTLAVAQDAPGLAGRVSLTQGQVTLSGALPEATAATVNWPVTSGMRITTAPGARTEFQVGSTTVRLDGDSALEVTELDDDSLRLRLDYGSTSIRIRNREAAAAFELATPDGRIRMDEPARIRVDTARAPNTTVLNVFDGTGVLDGPGSSFTVRAGRRAELRGEDVHTSLAVRDSFDDWSALRDARADRAATSWVPAEMTGYEDLDENGYWQNDAEYGPLWTPRTVPVGWVPYRDGRWTWLDPWGWTWIDNAPWGYAPFHYGRWVEVRGRWCWTPGHHNGRPAWAPALVGWVGGVNWVLNFRGHDRRPAQGWYPLSPRDRFVPSYRARDRHLRDLNADVRNPRDGRRDHDRDRDGRPHGLTVVPQAHFGHRGVVNVADAARSAPGAALQNAQPAPPPRPTGQGWQHSRHPGPPLVDQHAPRGDRPASDGVPQGDRTPSGDRPTGERTPRGDRPTGDRTPHGDRPGGDRAGGTHGEWRGAAPDRTDAAPRQATADHAEPAARSDPADRADRWDRAHAARPQRPVAAAPARVLSTEAAHAAPQSAAPVLSSPLVTAGSPGHAMSPATGGFVVTAPGAFPSPAGRPEARPDARPGPQAEARDDAWRSGDVRRRGFDRREERNTRNAPAAEHMPAPAPSMPAIMPQPMRVAPQPVAVAAQPVAVAPRPVHTAPQPVAAAPQPVAVAPQPAAQPAPPRPAPAERPQRGRQFERGGQHNIDR